MPEQHSSEVGVAGSAPRFDVFVSYGHADAPWVQTLADNLVRLGLSVFLDRYELVSGDLLAARLQDGLARTNCVALVVSANSLGRGWVEEEFSAAVAGVVAGTQRLVPVLLGDVALPLFVASRLWVDFRAVTAPDEYLAKVQELAAALRHAATAPRPAVGEPLVVPAGLAARAEGPTAAVLRLGRDRVEFSTASREVGHVPPGVGRELVEALYELDSARARPSGAVLAEPTTDSPNLRGPAEVAAKPRPSEPVPARNRAPRVDAALSQVGRQLGELFLQGEAGAALTEEIERAQARNSALRLGLVIADDTLAELPWETLRLPGAARPLALTDRVELHRLVPDVGSPGPALQVPSPLKILAVIASPTGSTGPLLDYEAELGQILDAVDPARAGTAQVRILEWGTTAGIRAALDAERFHVLHLSCHAGPGKLQLEKADGGLDEVDLDRFVTEVLPPDRGIPLIVLAGCSTALTPQQAAREDAESAAADEVPADQGKLLAGLARGLVERGVPAVLAMTAAVTDRYATALAAQMYSDLAVAQRPFPLAALARARRTLEAARAAGDSKVGWWAEWATPALYTSSTPAALFDRSDRAVPLADRPEPTFDTGMVVRRVGQFVGRREEQRRLLRALRSETTPGVLIHGIGGVGKSTLTAQLIHHLGEQTGVLVPVSAATDVSIDSILETFRKRLYSACVERNIAEDSPLHRVVVALSNAATPWQQRLDLISQVVLPRLPVLILLDNSETLLVQDAATPPEADAPLRWRVADEQLAEFLAALITAGNASNGRIKLIVTSRYPFTLPSNAHERLLTHHLGPLSLAETRKLIWRLPALDALPAADQVRAITDVGGHPRTLEYLDALLAGGQARFADLDERMRAALRARKITDPDQWLVEAGEAGVDRALAEAVTLAVDDTLLDSLLELLSAEQRDLLIALAVHRAPIDPIGVAWSYYGPEQLPDLDQDLFSRLQSARAALAAIDERLQAGEELEEEEQARAGTLFASYEADLNLLRKPPVDVDDASLGAMMALLTDLGLVTPSWSETAQDTNDRVPIAFVHRWTATALATLVAAEQTALAHLRVAAYHEWRVLVWQQNRYADITDLLEARYHRHAAGDLERALFANDQVCKQLDTWGAWDWSRSLHEQTVGWTAPGSRSRAVANHQLSILAYRRGDYPAAEAHCQKSLSILEELGDRAGVSSSYHQLGMLAQARGDYPGAEVYYRRALTIDEERGDRAGASSSYHQLGMLAQARGDYPGAEVYYRRALTIKEERGDRAGASSSYHQLGMLAQARGDYPGAEVYYRNSLTIDEERGDRAGVARSYHQLGNLAYLREDFPGAEVYYRNSLSIFEELGDRIGVAGSYHQLGNLAYRRGDYPAAEVYYQNSLTIEEELGNPVGVAGSHHQLGTLAQAQGDYPGAEAYYRNSLSIFEELGDRAGVARSCHQLGMLAQAQGDYPGAEAYYRNSLSIFEELGDRAGVASSHYQSGTLAQAQEDYPGAEAYYREALTIKQELGDRVGVAKSYHQLGMLAQARGDYPTAETHYGNSLAINEELGDPADSASTRSQLGILATEQGDAHSGVAFQVAALATRLQIGDRRASLDLRWLGLQRHALGKDEFVATLAELLDPASAGNLISMLDRFAELDADAGQTEQA